MLLLSQSRDDYNGIWYSYLIKEPQTVGFTEARTQVQAETLLMRIDDDFASKHDIALVRHETELLRREVRELETRMEARI